jgi:hypothetical protein
VVLLVSLLVLLVMGVIATTVARTNQLQLHMAGNYEARIAAMQQALAVVDAVFARPANTLAGSGVGHWKCLADSADENCDDYALILEQEVLPAVGKLDVIVVRLAPEVGRMPILGEGRASSAVYYRVAKFEVRVAYDGAGEGFGQASVAQGVLVRLPDSARLDGGIL